MLIGIIGKPSVGKSMYFKAATLAEAEVAPHPFTTIKPNHAIGYVKVKDPAYHFYHKTPNPREGYFLNGWRFVPVDLLDVAGLVPGAHEGKGLGNQFLSDLSSADLLLHIIDASGSTNEKGEAVEEGSHDVLGDITFLEEEINLWFYSIIQKPWNDLSKRVRIEKANTTKAIAKQFSGLKITEAHVEEAIKTLRLNPEDPGKWTEDELKKLCQRMRETSKPLLIVANKMDRPTSKKNYERLREHLGDTNIIACSAESEYALKMAAKKGLINYTPGDNNFIIKDETAINSEQKAALEKIRKLMNTYGSTGVQQALDHAVFHALRYLAIFPGGVNKLEDSQGRVLPDCFLMPEGTTALDFAYRIHTDIGKNFIKAVDVKTKRVVGKEHVLQHEDIVEIVTRK